MYFFKMPNQFDLHKDHNYGSLNSKLKQENESSFLLSLHDIVSSQSRDLHSANGEENPGFSIIREEAGRVPVLPSHCFMGWGWICHSLILCQMELKRFYSAIINIQIFMLCLIQTGGKKHRSGVHT